jgi:hypothetical protein
VIRRELNSPPYGGQSGVNARDETNSVVQILNEKQMPQVKNGKTEIDRLEFSCELAKHVLCLVKILSAPKSVKFNGAFA